MFGSFHLRFLAHDFLFNQFAGGFLKHKMVGIQRAGYQSFAEAVHGVDNASGGILSHGIAREKHAALFARDHFLKHHGHLRRRGQRQTALQAIAETARGIGGSPALAHSRAGGV